MCNGTVVLICISLMSDVEYFCHMHTLSLVKCLFKPLSHFLNGVVCFQVFRILYVVKSFVRCIIGKYFFPVCGLFFIFLTGQRLYFDTVNLYYFSFIHCAFGVSILPLSNPQSQHFSLALSSLSFIVLSFTFRSTYYFALIFT